MPHLSQCLLSLLFVFFVVFGFLFYTGKAQPSFSIIRGVERIHNKNQINWVKVSFFHLSCTYVPVHVCLIELLNKTSFVT